MFDKWKAKRELVKAFKFYHKEYVKANKHYSHTFDIEYPNRNFNVIDEAYNDMQSLEDIVKALAYVLYSNFHMFDWEDDFWIKTYYDLYKDEGKEYLEQFNSNHDNNRDIIYTTNLSNLESWDIGQKALNTLAQEKGTIIFDTSTQKMYMSDGKNFIEIC